MFEHALQALIASGPVALVLGVLAWLLWQQNKELLQELRADKRKMIHIAMRVTKAVEALAGLDPPDEAELDDEGE